MGKGNSQLPMLGLLLPPFLLLLFFCCFFWGGELGRMGGYIRLMHMSPFCPPTHPSLSLMFSFFFFFFGCQWVCWHTTGSLPICHLFFVGCWFGTCRVDPKIRSPPAAPTNHSCSILFAPSLYSLSHLPVFSSMLMSLTPLFSVCKNRPCADSHLEPCACRLSRVFTTSTNCKIDHVNFPSDEVMKTIDGCDNPNALN